MKEAPTKFGPSTEQHVSHCRRPHLILPKSQTSMQQRGLVSRPGCTLKYRFVQRLNLRWTGNRNLQSRAQVTSRISMFYFRQQTDFNVHPKDVHHPLGEHLFWCGVCLDTFAVLGCATRHLIKEMRCGICQSSFFAPCCEDAHFHAKFRMGRSFIGIAARAVFVKVTLFTQLIFFDQRLKL